MAGIWDLVRENVKTITPYSPGKSSREVMEELGITEVTKLASNENPLGPSPKAIEAMSAALQDVYIYPDPNWTELRAVLGEFYSVDPEGIIIGRGSDEIIHMLGTSLLNPGEEVIYSMPPFALYPFTATVMNCKHVQIPSTGPRGMDHDLDAMLAAMTDKTKLVFIGNPCNPTGTILTAAQIDAFMQAVPDHVMVVFDEAYAEYVENPDYPDTLEYARQGRLCITLRTFSKAYALAGLRIGYGIAHPDVAVAIKLTCEPFNVSGISQVAAIASIRDPEQVRRSVAMNSAGKRQLYAAFEQMGIEYQPTEANFIFLDTGIDSRECFDLLMRRGVTVRTGEIFGFPTWIRVTIGTADQNQRFIDALADVLGR
ncbi:MAG: histidinol-phosphate transaminase [Armatimonadetes bacterium]|nr:histidinol-phosphate transaminase [Armatimonadota bacterium]